MSLACRMFLPSPEIDELRVFGPNCVDYAAEWSDIGPINPTSDRVQSWTQPQRSGSLDCSGASAEVFFSGKPKAAKGRQRHAVGVAGRGWRAVVRPTPGVPADRVELRGMKWLGR